MTKKRQRYRLDVTEFGGNRYVNLDDFDALHYAARQVVKAIGPPSAGRLGEAIRALSAALDPGAPERGSRRHTE